jgi:hypothetical protein
MQTSGVAPSPAQFLVRKRLDDWFISLLDTVREADCCRVKRVLALDLAKGGPRSSPASCVAAAASLARARRARLFSD